jgi:polyribonucleotide nucleotidyltransferase
MLDFGAVVEYLRRNEILLHVSELAWNTENVSDVVNMTMFSKCWVWDRKQEKKKEMSKHLCKTPREERKE